MENILKNIGLSENSQKIYLALVKNGEMSARLISQKTGLPRATVYDSFVPLLNMGLIGSREEDGKSLYRIGDPNAIELILDEKISSLTKTKKEVKGAIESLKKSDSATEPKIKFFSGREGVTKIFNDILWYKNIETYTLWPMNEMIALLGPEYLEWHNAKRVSGNIKLKSLRANGDVTDFKKYPYLADKDTDLRELRYSPKGIKLEMSYWIYADKTAFVSTGGTPFGFIVHSKEFTSMMLVNFNLLWNISKKSI